MEFNIADLFECVADAVPERERGRLRRRPAHLRRARRARRPGSRTCSRRSASRPATTSASTCATRSSTSRRCSRATRLRAVPINVNYRYVADELALPAATTPTLVALVPRRRHARRTSTRCARPALCSTVVVGLDDDVRRSSCASRASPARDLGPRSPDDHYVLYTGGTTGMPKGVVWRQEDIFFGGARRREPRRPADHRARARSRRRCSTTPRNGCGRSCRPATPGPTQFVSLALGPLMHASGQWSALGTLLGGGKVVLYDRAARRHGARARPRRARARERDATSSATRARARCSTRSPPHPAAGTRRRCGCSARAAASSRAT